MNEFWNPIWTTWTAGGALLLPLAGISIGIWAYFLRSSERLGIISRECRALEPQVADRGLDEPGEGFIGHALSAIRQDIDVGTLPRSAFEQRGDQMLSTLNRDVVILAALTAVAPLVGLLGTVRGMILTFSAVSQIAGDTGTSVAAGISQALITTQFGLVIALPGVFGVSRLRALIREVEARFGTLRATALARLEVTS